MLRIAVVEDHLEEAETLLRHLDRYQQERNVKFQSKRFVDGVDFLNNYHSTCYDIVFMDIDMPSMNGLKAAAEFRKIDTAACLIFVTNMAQYALRGYEVEAMDFLVKPVPYAIFAYKLDKAVDILNKRSGAEHILKTKDGLIRIQIADIRYVEVNQHQLVYHTSYGDVAVWGALARVEKELKPHGFSRCNASYLVNLRYVSKVDSGYAFLGQEQLPVTRGKRGSFLQDMAQFLGV